MSYFQTHLLSQSFLLSSIACTFPPSLFIHLECNEQETAYNFHNKAGSTKSANGLKLATEITELFPYVLTSN